MRANVIRMCVFFVCLGSWCSSLYSVESLAALPYLIAFCTGLSGGSAGVAIEASGNSVVTLPKNYPVADIEATGNAKVTIGEKGARYQGSVQVGTSRRMAWSIVLGVTTGYFFIYGLGIGPKNFSVVQNGMYLSALVLAGKAVGYLHRLPRYLPL